MRARSSTVLAIGLLFALGSQASDHNSIVDFSSGTQGWEGSWDGIYSNIDASMGNAAPAYHTHFSTYGLTYVNSSNPDFIGDFTRSNSITFSLDINVLSMAQSDSEFGGNADRDLVIELRDHNAALPGWSFSSVWIDLGKLNAGSGWQHMQATISDTHSKTYIDGWSGNGSVDASGNPTLPPGVTFADILKSVDQIAITTFVPGYGYTPVDFDAAIDNVAVSASAVPEPDSVLLHVCGLAVLAGAAVRPRKAPPNATA
ncbi:PEP-CTERM sorting domain-containing protein [Paucibacter sp. R3-3]|uniref:PEP-CTERM sorting domain-containing protein n=1 Tax=Roseateles agri TaxID=3098619 RepID=A0ABU5DRY0_9BURK|nr:PEP-CTERM sorting domain-containing protein [Paucibacter sp. R3-3]MDY0749075.1 PEP-CTERM sorting domain-containing protein [Paucibacter sp. R3-3]